MLPIFWIDVVFYTIAALSSLGLAMMVLTLGPRHGLNRLFGLFTLMEAVWSSASIVYRLLMAASLGDGELWRFWLEVAAVGMTFMGPVLLLFATRYVGRQKRWTDVAASVGLLALVGLTIPLFRGQLISIPYISENGMVVYDLTALGYQTIGVPLIFFVWSAGLMWRERRRLGESYIAWSAMLLAIGFVLGGVLRSYLAFPVLSVSVSISAIVLGYGVISRQLLNPLRELTTDLESKVEERTQELAETTAQLEEAVESLAHRTRYLEATAGVARDAMSVLESRELYSRVVALVSERFGFHHTGLFIIDPTGEWAVLQASSSEIGKEMLAREHRVQVGGEGIVGYVTGQGHPRIVADVGANAVSFADSDMPDTRSRIVLPLHSGGRVIGALDVHSTEPEAFAAEDVTMLQSMADQITLAISNAWLFQQAQESLDTERRAYGDLTTQAWRDLLRKRSHLGYVRDVRGISPVAAPFSPRMDKVRQQKATVLDDNDTMALATPIKVRGRVIGVIDARSGEQEGAWTPEQITLLEQLADQLGAALDGARLHQDTQRHATRDRLIGEITTRMRETLDLDTVLRTAAHEMQRAFNLQEVEVRLGTGLASDELGGDGVGQRGPGGMGMRAEDDTSREIA